MKKNLFVILLFAAFLKIESAEIQIHANKDGAGKIESYQVWTWNGPDHEMVITKYTIAEAQEKFRKLLDASEAGTLKTPDRIFLYYNEDGTLYSIDSQVLYTKEGDADFSTVKKTETEISNTVKDDAEITKDDIEIKTEKTIDGNALN